MLSRVEGISYCLPCAVLLCVLASLPAARTQTLTQSHAHTHARTRQVTSDRLPRISADPLGLSPSNSPRHRYLSLALSPLPLSLFLALSRSLPLSPSPPSSFEYACKTAGHWHAKMHVTNIRTHARTPNARTSRSPVPICGVATDSSRDQDFGADPDRGVTLSSIHRKYIWLDVCACVCLCVCVCGRE